MNVVWLIVIGLLALMGLIEVIENIRRWMLKGKEECACFLCVPVSGEDGALEYKIRGVMERTGDSGFCARLPIYLVDAGLDPAGREICERLCEQYPRLRMCESGELRVLIESGLICNAGENGL